MFIICLLLGCASPQWANDNYCDDENNNAACKFDGGACCGPDVMKNFCSKCECLEGEGPI